MKFKSGFGKAGAAGFDFGNVIRQGDLQFDVPYKFRILMPVIPFKTVFYPALVADEEIGGYRQAFRVVRLPLRYDALDWKKEVTIFSDLRDIDLRIRKENCPVGVADRDLKSVFEPTTRWAFPVFDRRDEAPEVRIFEAGWTIFEAIRDLEKSLHTDDSTKLSHGPIWVWDVVITKKRKDARGRMKDRFNVKYEVKPRDGNPWGGKFSPDLVGDEKLQEELFQHSQTIGVFTSDEKFVIDTFDFDGDFIVNYSPMNHDRILKILADNPICADAVDLNSGNKIFPDPKSFVKELITLEVNYGLISSDLDMDKLPAPPPDKEIPGEKAEVTAPAAEVEKPKGEEVEKSKGEEVEKSKSTGVEKSEDKDKVEDKEKELPDFLKGLMKKGKDK